MTDIKKIVFLTAAAVIFCLCGIFLPQGTSPARESSAPAAEFSSEDAVQYLTLSAAIYSPDTFDDYMKEAGFEDYTFVEREQTPQYGSGVAFALSVRGNTLYAVIRGSSGCEWYSNFHIGEGESHAGFLSAADFLCQKIREYRREFFGDEKNIALVLTGHSRGGAVANLAAKDFIDNTDFQSVTAYTFASPNTTTRGDAHHSRYNSIFNIENPEDFICRIPPQSWGYTKFGQIIPLPDQDFADYPLVYSKMQENFLSITGYEHLGYEGGSRDVDEFISAAEDLAPTVRDYYHRKIPSPAGSITLWEYMNKAATMLCGENTLQDGVFLLMSLSSEEFSPLAKFMLQGVSTESAASTDLTKTPAGCAHTPETYLAWMYALDE